LVYSVRILYRTMIHYGPRFQELYAKKDADLYRTMIHYGPRFQELYAKKDAESNAYVPTFILIYLLPA